MFTPVLPGGNCFEENTVSNAWNAVTTENDYTQRQQNLKTYNFGFHKKALYYAYILIYDIFHASKT